MELRPKPKVMITGAAGFLGEALLRQFPTEYNLIAAANLGRPQAQNPKWKSVQADLLDLPRLAGVLDEHRPDIIINCAAWVDVDGCEIDQERALRSNYQTAKNLGALSEQQGSYLIQISTDYIFNGRDHPAKIDDQPDPVNFYGRTKLLAEEFLGESHSNYLIVRTCALFGLPQRGRTNLLNYFHDNLKASRGISVPHDLYSNPIWIDRLAQLIVECVQKRITGIIHLGGGDYISRCEFAQILAELFGFNRDLIRPIASSEEKRPARRPGYGGLNIEETIRLLDTPIPSIRESLLEIKHFMK